MNRFLKASLVFAALSVSAGCNIACHADQPISLDRAQLVDAVSTPVSDGLKVNFGKKDAWPHILWKAPTALGWDWSQYGVLQLTLTNPGSEDVEFYVRVDDHAENGLAHNMTAGSKVLAGQTEQFYINLQSRTARASAGMKGLPSIMHAEYGMPLGLGVEPSHIEDFQIFRSSPTKPATLIFRSIVLAGKPDLLNLDGIVDQYGQYTRADWPGKIHADSDFAVQSKAEAEDLDAHPVPSGRDKWGGWQNGPLEHATGYFRTEKVDNKWWLVDPDGHLFISVGVDCVNFGSSTIVNKRERMFTWLPTHDDPLSKFCGGEPKTLNLYGLNLQRKYGSEYVDVIRQISIKRLSSWGFNTIGNWSDSSVGAQDKLAYVATITLGGSYAHIPSGGRNKVMPDPFDPTYAETVDKRIGAKAALVKADPWCLGYFVDNELPWGGGSKDPEHYGIAYGALSLDSRSPAKQAFIALLKAKYGTIERLNASWGAALRDWDQLLAPYQAPSPLATATERADFSVFLTAYADRYFSVVADAIRRRDPNHLYLGCRFAGFGPEVVSAAAKYVDVISFNIYGQKLSDYLFAESVGKPLIIGEFHFGALDRGMFAGGMCPVKDQVDRGSHYAAYVQAALAQPAFVGCHWFDYVDEPTVGRSEDGENFNIGFVSITDTPYPELFAAARAANAQIYQWHAQTPSTR
ncbi:MAG: beta-galactosidase [Capsulimonadaceae bacterium]|nr:beta-galactosidase [Capsulimonadaceae bacterium]